MQNLDGIILWDLNSSGISSHPLALLTAVLPKAHLTSLSRMSGSGWLTTPSQSYGSSGSFLYTSSVCSFYLFLISSASTKSLPFMVLYCAHLWQKCSLDISYFPEEISSLSCSVVFFQFYTLIIDEGLVSQCCSLEICVFFGYIFPFLSCFSFLFFLQLFVRSPQKPLCLLAFLFLRDDFVHCLLYNIMDFPVHSSSGTLFTSSNHLNLFRSSASHSQIQA